MRTFALMATMALICAGCSQSADQPVDRGETVAADSSSGRSHGTSAASASASSKDGKEESLSFSIDTDGFSMDIDLPIDEITTDDANGRAEGLYPGSRVNGINIDSNSNNGASQSVVSIRFTAPADADSVADWFVSKMSEDGATARRNGNRIIGKTNDGEDYTITLEPSGDSTRGELRILSGD
ncbi:MAG: hypothetical protein AAFX04_08750 [Pseudomonadota bacterium]